MSVPIPAPVLGEIAAEVVRWASQDCHEPAPRNIRVVATTRDAAHALVWPGTRSGGEPVYFAVAEGDFHLTGRGATRNGVWAGLFISHPPARVTAYTLRPEADIPDLDLSLLGQVYAVA
ncbi:hypothetical protein [Streptomyces sp. WAC 04229]|uniref:hypothetical protein n=1 Tax=Streptomyces sp. WAC 04229 TaxID=2203206 RepID=UPI003D7060C8